MDLSQPDWSQVQSFLAVAETGSLSSAARHLGLSQPTLGRHIKAMEERVGNALFTRHARGLRLTEAGTTLLPHAMAMRDASQALQLTAAGQLNRESGTVRVTASVFASHFMLPAILAELRAEAPEIQIELVPSDTTENLLFREADIAVRMYRPTQLDIVTRHVTDVRIGAFAAKTYLARRGYPSKIDDFMSHDLVGFDRDDLIIRTMADQGWNATREWFDVRCDNQATYWALVRAGCGIGFSQACVALADPLIEELPFDLDLAPLPIWLAAPNAMRHTPRIRRVWDFLVQKMSTLT